MPTFNYKAVSSEGEVLEGRLEAVSREAVIERLKELGHTPIRAEREEAAGLRGWRPSWSRRRPLSLVSFTRDLANLLGSGIPLDRALEMLVELAEEERAARVIGELLDQVRGGAGLADAMERQPAVFGRFSVNMVRAGEAAGALDSVLERLAEFHAQYDSLKSSVRTALIYPAILALISAASLIVLMIFVVPQFTTLFEEMGQELPLVSRVVFAAGELLQGYWWLLLAIIAGGTLLLRRKLGEPAFRERWDNWLLGLPVVGALIARVEAAVFARTLGTLLSNGVSLLSALAIVRDTLGNRGLVEVVTRVMENAKEGHGLAQTLLADGRFPRLVGHMVKVGEESGRLESALLRVADIYDREVKLAIQRALALLEPVIIIGLGLLIGAIIISILMALLSVNQLVF